MNSRFRTFPCPLAVASALVCAAFCAGATGNQQPTTSNVRNAPDAAAPEEVDLASIQCAEGEERFLPGDYYFCVGSRYMGRERYFSARDMFRLAAGWGNKTAQYVLGLMYFNGEHVPVNRPLGLAWLALSAEREDAMHRAVLLSAHNKSSAAERLQAEQLLADMRPKYADRVAAARAKRRYDRAYYELTRNEAFGVRVCINGITQMAAMGPGILPTQINCPPAMVAAKRLDHIASNYFAGWEGVVHVGRLIQVPSPAAAAPASPHEP